MDNLIFKGNLWIYIVDNRVFGVMPKYYGHLNYENAYPNRNCELSA